MKQPVLIFLLCLPGLLFAQLDLTRYQGDCFGQYTSSAPPILYEVHEGTVQANYPILLTAKVGNDPAVTEEITEEVTLHYSLDEGKTFTSLPFTEKETEAEVPLYWEVTLPAQPKGQHILYYLSARDTAGNVATEVPGKVTQWPPKPDTLAQSFPEGLKDEECQEIKSPMFDILRLSYTYDDEHIYGLIQTRGKIEQGHLSPPQINGFFTGVIPVEAGLPEFFDIISEVIGSSGLPAQGGLFIWAPLLKDIGGSAMGIQEDYTFMTPASSQIIPPFIDSAQASSDAVVQDNTLYFKFSRALAGDAQVWKGLAIALYLSCGDLGSFIKSNKFATCLGTDIDLSLFITTTFRTHEILVGGT